MSSHASDTSGNLRSTGSRAEASDVAGGVVVGGGKRNAVSAKKVRRGGGISRSVKIEQLWEQQWPIRHPQCTQAQAFAKLFVPAC